MLKFGKGCTVHPENATHLALLCCNWLWHVRLLSSSAFQDECCGRPRRSALACHVLRAGTATVVYV